MTTKTTSTYGIYTVETYSGYGTYSWTVPSTITSIDVILVGGGASGWSDANVNPYWGDNSSLYEATLDVSGSYVITVGNGGSAGRYVSGMSYSGGLSSIGSLASVAGGIGKYLYFGDYLGITYTYWGVRLNNVGGGGCGWNSAGSDGIVILRYITPTASLTTEAATLITNSGMTCNGTVTDLTAGHIDIRGFCYIASSTAIPTTSDSEVHDDGSFATGAYSKAITGLSAGTAYRIAAYATTNAGVTSYGNTITVITINTGEIDYMEYAPTSAAQLAYVSTGGAESGGVTGKLVCGYQFRKEIPNTESHIFAQIGDLLLKSNNTTDVPNQDTFSRLISLPSKNYLNFSEAPDQSVIACDGYTNYVYSGDEYRVAKFINFDSALVFSYDYTEVVNNNLSDSTNVAILYPTAAEGAAVSIYVGSTRPINGIKFYMSTVNASAATLAVTYWGGTSFDSVTTLVDGTAAVAGTPLGQDGIISFDTTLGLCKVKSINENVAYYYRIVLDGIDTATSIKQVSLVASAQNLVDIWDGSPRQIYSFLKDTADLTSNVYKLDYYASDTTTFAQIGGMTTSVYLYAGFNERLLGMKFYLGETSVNTNALHINIYYWSGTDWTEVTVDDATIGTATKSFSRSGVITWNPPSSNAEYTTSVGNSAQWYYYKIGVSATVSADCRIDNITGIPAQVSIPPYRFPVIWHNRLWLFNDQSRNKNVGIGSAYGTVCVFNGLDSPRLTFGGTQEVICAAPLFTRFGGSIYENLIVCKRNQTYLVDGTSPTTYIVYKIANSVGCISAHTMKVCDTGYEVAPGLTKHVVVWLSSAGVVMFDANSVINISGDISDRFDQTSDNYINVDLVDKFAAFYDSKRTTYHIMIATGSSTTLNEEWAYDLTRKKWYYISRGTKYLTCGFDAEDALGNKYSFGGASDGYLEYLENGYTFDGVPITYIFRLPDGILDKSLTTVKEVRRIKLTGKINDTVGTISVNHYGDGSDTASTPAISAISQDVTDKRIYQIGRSVSFKNVLHSFEFEITTTDSDSGFNPLFVSGLYRVVREDLQDGD